MHMSQSETLDSVFEWPLGVVMVVNVRGPVKWPMFHCIIVSGSLALRSDSSSRVTISGIKLTVEVMRASNRLM